MAIVLRADKTTALTYSEVDNNFISFFYSASVSSNQEYLNLHYTGSSGLGVSATQIQIPLNPYTGSTPPVGGNSSTVQYNNGGSFGGDDDFRWNAGTNTILLGANAQPESDNRLSIRDGGIKIQRTSAASETELTIQFDDAGTNYSSSFKLNETGDGSFNITNHHSTPTATPQSAGIHFIVNRYKTTPALSINGDGSISTRNANSSHGDNNLSGSLVVDGNNNNINAKFRVAYVDSNNTTVPFTSAMNNVGNQRGFMLDGPDKGHVIVGLKSFGTATTSQTFSILSGPPTSSNFDVTYNKLVAMFKGNGQVGIGTDAVGGGTYKLTVAGGISGSFIDVTGTATIEDDTEISGSLYVSQSTTLDDTLTLNSVANATSATNYNYLVRESNGAVTKQVNAAPIPQGGIIMWSGVVQTLPSGWALCNGQTQNSITTPDLRNKFVIGSNNTTGTPTTTVQGSGAQSTGGSITHNHGGSTGDTTLTTNQIPSHKHDYKDSYYIEINDPGVGQHKAISGVDGPIAGGPYKGSGDSDNDNQYVYYRNGVSYYTGGAGSHNHSITTDSNIPPYFALAYIMYTG